MNCPLLTIAIPTYNRSNYLDLCLSQICRQIKGKDDEIELIVSNNNSTDDTDDVVRKYMESGVEIRYVKNVDNIGGDNNIVQCFDLARGKYALILADDDTLCDGAIEAITPLLKENYGIIYLNSYKYDKDYIAEAPKRKKNNYIVYENKAAFIRKVHVQLTFISANVVNKSLIRAELDTSCFLGTNLSQLSWVFHALFKADRNVYCNRLLVAQKADNTGGYNVCSVFGVNMQRIFNAFIARGIEKRYFNIISRTLLVNFIPSIILSLKKNQGSFIQEDYFSTLAPTYKNAPLFWLATVPVIVLPYKAGKLWHRICKLIMKIFRLPFKFQT